MNLKKIIEDLQKQQNDANYLTEMKKKIEDVEDKLRENSKTIKSQKKQIDEITQINEQYQKIIVYKELWLLYYKKMKAKEESGGNEKEKEKEKETVDASVWEERVKDLVSEIGELQQELSAY